MKPPCDGCLTLPICKMKVKENPDRMFSALDCPLVVKYALGPNGLGERPMHVSTRINKISKIMKGRKIRNGAKKYPLC